MIPMPARSRANVRRWIDRSLTVLAAAGIALALGLLALWVRSAWVVEALQLGVQPQRQVGSGGGCLTYFNYGPAWPKAPPPWTYAREPRPLYPWRWAVFKRGPMPVDGNPAHDARMVVVPHWFAAAVVGLPAASFLFVRRARRRRRAARLASSVCIRCGYDLRGGHARCPECGTIVPRGKMTGSNSR
jgi:hypothetical protein